MTTRVLIIFGSTYGYTEQYATWLAEDLRALPQAPEVETVPALPCHSENCPVAFESRPPKRTDRSHHNQQSSLVEDL